MVSSGIRLTAWLQNSKKRSRNGQVDVWAESPRLSPLWLSASSSACHGLLIITVITPLPTKPSATKMPELKLANAADYWHADASAWCCCARCKIHRDCTITKLKMMLCVMMLPLVVVGCTSKQSVSQCVKPPPPPAWIVQPPRLARHRWTGLFHPEGWSTMQKQLAEGTQKYINEQVQIELPISMGNSY